MLHTVKDSPFGHRALEQALHHLQPQDRLVLWQDAVIAATVPAWQARLQTLADSDRLYVMQEDLQARGLHPGVGESIAMERLVELVAELGSPQAW
ncbi:sulfurtransferase complex subunit TusB [Oceanisphaera psychrotolerans]|uniref:Sulfurtransferase TusB n=1 Tax=Oceanisphaera psychrotolerans TaxID=1414654 RepID=A0A1J4Q9S0_9GAMM|nr:sulfurtransferase complex subunit TusB [Oceanisphaera psychrotolerans]OIN03823.1 sulfurtransferase TusB [Oceanisphaera psychrotolerans]